MDMGLDPRKRKKRENNEIYKTEIESWLIRPLIVTPFPVEFCQEILKHA